MSGAFYASDFVKFVVTGVTTDNKRFRRTYEATTSGWMWANGINLYRGSVWGVTPEGKRRLLKRAWN